MELILQVCSFIIPATSQKLLYNSQGKNTKYGIEFIGDSWTQGADAPLGKGYVDVFSDLIKKEYPDINFEIYNFGTSSYNSSEACISFLKTYKSLKPSLLFILSGVNNAWKSSDNELALRYFEHELSHSQIYKVHGAMDFYNELRTVKLIKLLYFNLVTTREQLYDNHGNHLPGEVEYIKSFSVLNSSGKKDAARDYLVLNMKRAPSYDCLYRAILLSFDLNFSDTEKFLRERGIWKPGLIKNGFNQKNHEYYVTHNLLMLERDLTMLKTICDKNQIIMVIQSYPFYGEMTYYNTNIKLQETAQKNAIPFLDHYALFQSRLGIARWKTMMTQSHINENGHLMMAGDILEFIRKQGLFLKNTKSTD